MLVWMKSLLQSESGYSDSCEVGENYGVGQIKLFLRVRRGFKDRKQDFKCLRKEGGDKTARSAVHCQCHMLFQLNE